MHCFVFITVGSSHSVIVTPTDIASEDCDMSNAETEQATKLLTDETSNFFIYEKTQTTQVATLEVSFTDYAETTEHIRDRTSGISITKKASEHVSDGPSSVSITEETTEIMTKGAMANIGKITWQLKLHLVQFIACNNSTCMQ